MRVTAADMCWDLPPLLEPHESSDDFIVDLILGANAYRLLAQQALHVLRAEVVRVDRLRHALQQARDEARSLRERHRRDSEGRA